MTNNTTIFCERVWNTKQDIYIKKLDELGFNNMNSVLDAGGGCGQWTNALAVLNKHVDYVEPDLQRVDIAKSKISHPNVSYFNCPIENFNFKQESYNGIFCYSMIYFCDLEKTLSSFYESLNIGGKLYICSNNIDYYFHNIVNDHNSNQYFNAKDNAFITIKNALMYHQNKHQVNEYPVIYSDCFLVDKLEQIGFQNITVGHEGDLSGKDYSFYPPEKFGYKSVYEIIAYK